MQRGNYRGPPQPYSGLVQFGSVAQSCPTLCDSTNHSRHRYIFHWGCTWHVASTVFQSFVTISLFGLHKHLVQSYLITMDHRALHNPHRFTAGSGGPQIGTQMPGARANALSMEKLRAAQRWSLLAGPCGGLSWQLGM